MAGSDMSKNLGGMLSGAAGALGTMGSTYTDSLNRNIENITRPNADPTDIASQQALMQWQTNMGRTEEAALSASNIEQQRAADALKAEKEKEAKKAEGQQRIAKLAQSMQAIAADPKLDPAKRTEILQALQSAANAEAMRSGLDQEKVMGMSNKAINAAQDQKQKDLTYQIQQGEQVEKQEMTNLTQALSAVDLLNPDVQETMKTSPLAQKYPKIVNDAIKMEQDIAKENKANAAAVSKLREPVNMDTLSSMKGAFAKDSAEYKTISDLERDVKEFNDSDSSATEVNPGKKAGLLNRITQAVAAYKQPYQLQVGAELQTEKNYEAKWKDVAKTAVTKGEKADAKARLMDEKSMLENAPIISGFVEPSTKEIEAEVLRHRRATVNLAYGKEADASPYSSATTKLGTEQTAAAEGGTPPPPPPATSKYNDGEVRQRADGTKWKYNAKTKKWTKV